MPNSEIEEAMKALMDSLCKEQGPVSLPKLVEKLQSEKRLREDTLRLAFWYLIDDGRINLNHNFAAEPSTTACAN